MSSRRGTTEQTRHNKNYSIYCINFHGTGLNAIKDEFKKQIKTGLRKSVFVLDLQDLQQEVMDQKRNTQQNPDSMENSQDSLMSSVEQAIENIRREYATIMEKINKELKFDLYEYWLKDLENKSRTMPLVEQANVQDKISLNSTKASKPSKVKKRSVFKKLSTDKTGNMSCVPLKAREHNRVVRREMLTKRKYIKDEPSEGKLYIIIIGHHHTDEQFYGDLLRRGQPVQAIVHFLPTESKYDILVNNNKLRAFIRDTWETIDNTIYQLRQKEIMKSVGLFTYELPIISTCLASKYQKDIFDQLSWEIYDIEVLEQQYQLYYCKHFQEINVALAPNVNLQMWTKVRETETIQGHFQGNPLPASAADVTTCLGYLHNLLNHCDHLEATADERATLKQNSPNSPAMNGYSSAFESLIKIPKFQRLFIEEANGLLNNILLYVDQVTFGNVYLSCWDYHFWRGYFLDKCLTTKNTPTKYPPGRVTPTLSGLIELCCSKDSCYQRISQLISAHNDYDVIEFQPGWQLYTFRKIFNVVLEYECLEVIPTRLCFRDFTLFQREEFLENLTTTEMLEVSQDVADEEKKLNYKDEDLYIRPNSLKALKCKSLKDNSSIQQEKTERNGKIHSPQYNEKPSQKRLGLPPNHHLLQGYNLDNTRQEVKIKTTKYFFDQGSLQLYEEKWCFQDMNKQLTLAINNNSLYFNPAPQLNQGLSHNIRLNTQHNINIRILNEPHEWAPVIMNYPNGLAVYYSENHCEQAWFSADSFRGEQRRIYTPYGAIIVFYKTEDMILIMRYNGEVYKLYQYELVEEAEEEDIFSDLTNNPSYSFQIDPKAKGDHVGNKAAGSEGYSWSETSKEGRAIEDHLKSLIDQELTFLQYISWVYCLSYRHLIVTTSQGKVINLTQEGKIFEGKYFRMEEWHDYYANESYCHRSDGVKMIWTQDALKCYHTDGSVFTTKTKEDFLKFDMDEYESRISQSSSHDRMAYAEESSPPSSTNYRNGFSTPNQSKKFTYSSYLAPGNAEEDEMEDIHFINYTCSSWLMQHHQYAEVYIQEFKSLPRFQVKGIGNIFISTVTDDQHEKEPRLSNQREGNYDQKSCHSSINVWIEDSLHLTVDQEGCEIYAVMKRDPKEDQSFECNCPGSDSLTLRVSYQNSLKDIFNYFVTEIGTFQNKAGPRTENLYFVLRHGQDCKVQGFEFLKCMPEITNLGRQFSNCILDVKPVKSIKELMSHTYDWYEKDMKKFPRFKVYKSKSSFTPGSKFPSICSTRIFCKISPALQNSEGLKHFLEPLEKLQFKKLRPKMKQLLEYHLKPQLQMHAKRLYSHKSWLKRHRLHEKRKFKEQQRTGLYHAMLKHCRYPNYFQFTANYQRQVCHIDFFDFMQVQAAKQEISKG